jgi:hypothetical protein
MVSVREMAQCIGISGNFSIVRDFFGHRMGIPRLSQNSPLTVQLSLLKQIHLLQSKHIHLDVIRVGSFTVLEEMNIDYAVYKARETYAQVDLGIGRVAHFLIPEEDADGLEEINSHSEAKKLAKKYRGPHDDAIDVFIVMDFNVTSGGQEKAGICDINLPCNKNLYHFDGAVMGVRFAGGVPLGSIMLGQVLAHEVGHGLGLYHTSTVGNLMFGPDPATGFDLSSDQGEKMRSHCFVQSGC